MENIKEREIVEPRTVTLYPSQWAVVDQQAQRFRDVGMEGNVSHSLRFIVAQWAQAFKEGRIAPLPLDVSADADMGVDDGRE